MHLFPFLNVVVLLTLGIGVSSTPVAHGTTSHCNARDIAIVKRTANEPTYFCTWWNSDTRTRTPFLELTVSQVNNACKCISKSSKNKRAAPIDHPVLSKGKSVESCRIEMSKQFTEPWHFCKFYTAYPRTTSPFRKYNAKSLLVLCDCVLGKSIPTTTKRSSTKKTSVTKTTIKSSSTKPSSSKKPISSLSKKTTSSSKKLSLSSSSSRKATLSSTKTATSTKTSSTTKPMSTSKSSTSSLRKPTSSSNLVSDTRKTSSSTQVKVSSSPARSVLSARQSSVSKSSTSTSIKPSSLTRSSSKSLSSSKSSVYTTTSSKSSSKLLSSSESSARVTLTSSSKLSTSSSVSSSSTTKTSTSVSSVSATKTATARTDGQFYLRIASTTSPPDDYYITVADGYSFGPSRQLVFGIGSNGYLYQLVGSDQYWIGTTFREGGYGYLGGYAELGQYSSANFICSYDESYLLSCAAPSSNGTLTPVTWSYKEFSGGYFEWMVFSNPDDQPTIDLYVELAVPSTSSTASSSDSTISSTSSPIIATTVLSNTSFTASSTTLFNATSSSTAFPNATRSSITLSNATSSLTISSTTSAIVLSTASSNASATTSSTTSTTSQPTCTLSPSVANGGFEDGTDQTAWSAKTDSFSSWAPTTTNPYDGDLSGQFTFRISGGYFQASSSVRLNTTLSNLCPGFKYSISYHSYCAVPSRDNCFIALWTTELGENGSRYSVTYSGTSWYSSSDILEFTAASSTSTLYVYVGTVADNQGVGNIYLDDFGISLLGNEEHSI